MYCFAKICCLCLQYNPDLKKLEDLDSNGLSFFEKLIVLIPGFETLLKKSIPNYICRKCKRYLNKFVKFQQNCLKSYNLLVSYIKQLDNPDVSAPITSNPEPEINIIEDDLLLMKEDMKECLKNMEIYVKVDSIKESKNRCTPAESSSSFTQKTNQAIQNPEPDASTRKRTRKCKQISYNEDYDSDTMISDSELYYTKGAKRKAKQTEDNDPPRGDKTVVIAQNDVFAKDLTKTINDIITRLSADSSSTSKPEEFKVQFKNSSGNTEELSIHQDKDTVEIKFTKEEKMGHLKVYRSGDSFILTHNMSEASGTPPTNKSTVEQLKEVPPNPGNENTRVPDVPEQTKLYICDRTSPGLKKHINDRPSTLVEPLDTPPEANTSPGVKCVDAGPEEAPGSKPNQFCEIKVVLSEIQEAPVKSERSSSPEYQFHLSDDTDDEFDNDTVILENLDHDNDFPDTKSPSPVQLGSEVLGFLDENDAPDSLKELETVKNPRGNEGNEVVPKKKIHLTPDKEETASNRKLKTSPGDVFHPNGEVEDPKEDSESNLNGFGDVGHPQGHDTPKVDPKTIVQHSPKNNSNGINLDDSYEDKYLKIIINKTEVDDFIKNKSEESKKMAEKRRCSPRSK